jgi:hypothetical protein
MALLAHLTSTRIIRPNRSGEACELLLQDHLLVLQRPSLSAGGFGVAVA